MNDKREEARYDTVKNLYDVYGVDKPGYSTTTSLYGKDLFEELDKDPELTYRDLYLLAGDLESAVKAFDFLLKKHEMTKEDLEEYIKYKRGQLGIDNKESKISDNKEKEKVDSTEKSDVQENPEKGTGVEDKPEAETVDDSELQKLNDLIMADPLQNLTLETNKKRNKLIKEKSQSMSNVETKNDSANYLQKLFANIKKCETELEKIKKRMNEISSKDSMDDIDETFLKDLQFQKELQEDLIKHHQETIQKINDSDELKSKGKEGKILADSFNNNDREIHPIPLNLKELEENDGTKREEARAVSLIDRLRDLEMIRKIKSAIDFVRKKSLRNKKQLFSDTAELSEEQAEAIKMGAMESAGASVEDDGIEIPEENIDLQSVEESAKSR